MRVAAAIVAVASGILLVSGCGGEPEPLQQASSAATTSGRLSLNFNQSWKFMLGDYSGAEAAGYNDSAWENVGLPHSFSLPYFAWTQFYSGYGWYRKHFNVPAEWTGKQVFAEFQAAFQDAQVFINGKQVGRHQGGYNGFSIDLTSGIVTGDNVVAVRLNNLWNAQLAPRGGDHQFSGGIYRDVNLVVTDPLRVAWYGTFVTTPTLASTAGASSTVNIKTELRNDRTASTSCSLRTEIQDANGNLLTSVTSTQTIAAGTTVTFDQTTPAVSIPSLWHPDHPTLYRAVSIVSDGSGEVDRFTTSFGFRYFTWSATSGFSLNGSRYYFNGANVHQDHAGWGDAVADSASYRDVKMVKEVGFNFIRGSHYPHSPAFSEACDQLGVLLWSENPFWGSASYGEGTWDTGGAYPSNSADQAPFESSVLTSLTEMIRIHRNHPSIIAWSMSNEPYFTNGSTMDKMRALLTKEVTLEHQLDPTRPAGIGGCQRPADSGRIDLLGDIAGYNGDGATISMFQNPGKASVVTEYGTWSGDRPGNYAPNWGSLGEQLGSNNLPNEFSWRSGQSIWCMFDHGTIKGSGLGKMGLVDYFRVPKRAWYWYRNTYAHVAPPTWPSSGTPAGLKLTASDTTLSAVNGTKDSLLTVTVVDSGGRPISNNVPVTLTVTSGPGEFPTGPSITFRPPSTDPQSDIQIRDGVAAIEFRSYYSGTSVITASSPGLPSSSVTITSQGTPAYVPGVTPPAPTRAYSRYSGGQAPVTTLTVALNRPTSASSTATGTNSAAANDGNTSTSWLASSTDSSPWWRVFLEGSFSVNTLEVTFPTAANYRYTIGVSSDGSNWTTVVDQSQTTSTAQTQRATGAFGNTVQYVRVNFVGVPAGQPAGVAELVVGGTSGGATYTLNVARTGNGTISGGGLDCGALCNAVYVNGTSVVLTATADDGSSFLSWGGACSGSAPTCTVSMTAAKSVTATFSSGPPTSYPLTVTKSGNGMGTVTGGPITCGTTCSANVDIGASVTLTAAADAGSSSTFVGWSGACTGASATCTVTMNAAQTVTATFSAPPGTVAINAGGAATGNFVADAYFSGGSTYSTTNSIDTSSIPATVPQDVFQTERYGEHSYTIPGFTAGSTCSVTLYFEESYLTAAGQRLFDVSINGTKVLTGFDIFAEAGTTNKAVAKTFTTTADASGQVAIQLTKGAAENPKICGVSVVPMAATCNASPSAPANLSATAMSTSQIALAWSGVTPPANCSVTYSVFRGSTQIATGLTSASFTDSGLSPSSAYSYTVKAVDSFGASASSNTATATTLTPLDTVAPSAPTGLSASNVTASSVALSWSPSSDNVGVAGYDLYAGSSKVASSSIPSATVSSLSAATPYTFTVRARDAAGNVSQASSGVTVTTLDGVDITPPSAPANLTWAADGLTVSLTWSASTDDVGVTGYKLLYGSFDLGTFSDTVLTLIGFKPGTPYTFTVKARDAAGNFSVASNATTVLLAAPPDTTPPTAPTNVISPSVTSSSVALRWTASTDDVGVVVYQVLVNGSVAATVTSASATVNGLSSGTTYSITIRALDAAGNTSPSSGAISVTTS